MLLHRRQLITCAAAGAAAIALQARAQGAYPYKPITLVVPLAAGGSVDNSGRLIAERLTRELGQSVVVDNRAGATGAIGSSYVAKSAPDGYTLIVMSQTTHVFNPALNPRLPYDALNDFIPITIIDRQSNVLLINPALPIHTFDDFVKYAKANPGKLNYASSGIGSVAHLSMEVLKAKLGLYMTHIPYRGSGGAITDLMSGLVQVTWTNLSSNLANIRSGKLRAIAIAAPSRAPQLPEVPTFLELKLPDLNMTSWNGLGAPAGTPDAVIARLYQAMRRILDDPATQKVWLDKGMIVPEAITPVQYKAEIAERIKYFGAMAKANHIVAE